jgi:hypothetical protein
MKQLFFITPKCYRILVVFFFIFLISCNSFAQENSFDNFTTLQSEGILPDQLTTLSYDKYKNQSKNKRDHSTSQFDEKAQKEFYQSSNFLIDELLLSGKIVFNDPVTDYINEVAAILLKDEPKLKKELKFFTAKSAVYNASSTDQGIIFINTGLIARLTSEAQLAFILAHEIAHYTEKHNINSYLEKQRIKHSKGIYKGSDIHNAILDINKMSKDDEMEADQIAYKRFYKNSGYTLSELDTLFHYMLVSEAPFGEVVFNLSFFEDHFYSFPLGYHLDSLPELDFDKLAKKDEEMESSSEHATHPAIRKRKMLIKRMKIMENDNERKSFIVSREQFDYVKKACQFESLRQLVLSHNYIDVIYNSFVLQQEYPNNKYLETLLASSLYQISHLKTYSEYAIVKNDEFSMPASNHGIEVQKLQYLFDKMNSVESTVLSLRYLNKIMSKYGASEYTNLILDDLLSDLIIENKHALNEFFTEDELVASPNINSQDQKYNELYYLNALAQDITKNDKILNELQILDKKRAQLEEEEANYNKLSHKEKSKQRKDKKKQEQKYDRRLINYGASLKINKIVVADPKYIKINSRKNTFIDYKDSEMNKIRYVDRIEKCNKASNLEVKMINTKNLRSTSVNELNNLSLLNEWIGERSDFNIDYDFVPYSSYLSSQISDYYDTKYCLWTGVFSERRRKDFLTVASVTTVLTSGFGLPVVLIWGLIPEYDTYYYSILFDIKTGEKQLAIFQEFAGSDLSGDFINSSVYDTFNQIAK